MQTTELRSVDSPATVRPLPGRPGLVTAVLSLTTFVAAALLFSVQPMVAKLLLPHLGGSPSVWNTAMVFFQLTLLAGYLYAHLATTRLSPRVHRVLQVVLIASLLFTLPVAIPAGWEAPSSGVSWWMMVTLAVMIGGPFLALSTVSPTLQRWLAESDHPRSGNPYFLYAASNSGSLLALLAYPLLLEPWWSVDVHTAGWTVGYAALVVLVGISARLARPRHAGAADDVSRPDGTGISWKQRAFWVYAAMVPSALMLGVTRHLATDVASFPLLWVIPLAVYLLTFIVAFRGDSGSKVRVSGEAVRFLGVPLVVLTGVAVRSAAVLVLPLLFFAAAALMAHSRLYATRPEARNLTDFYLWVSVGGALGGVAAALIAPVLFDSIAEYPIAIALAISLLPASRRLDRKGLVAAVMLGAGVVGVAVAPAADWDAARLILALVVAVAAYAAVRMSPAYAVILVLLLGALSLQSDTLLYEGRTFFGVYQVSATDGTHVFRSGTTLHGIQRDVPSGGGGPIGYYAPEGPIGRILDAVRDRPLDMALIGLGAGSLADYGDAADHIDFYEIDPVVVEIASDPALFTHLSRAEATVDVIVGDGRLELSKAPGGSHDVIVVDAFSSDAIPTHLITLEAIASYLEKLDTNGVLALHISNRHLDLEPIVGRIAHELGLPARIERFAPTPEQRDGHVLPSYWVVLTTSEASLRYWLPSGDWRSLDRTGPLWTDAHTSIMQILRLG